MTDAIPRDAGNLKEPEISLGIEEELFLVDPASRDRWRGLSTWR